MAKSHIELAAVDLAARAEIIRWANERLKGHRGMLESVRCDEQMAGVLRGRIAELRRLVAELEGKRTEDV